MSELLTTEAVPAVDRLDFWREVICAVYVELDAEPVSRTDFAGTIDLTSWGDTRISRVTSEGQVVTRRPGADKSDCLVSLQVAGTGQVSQAGRTAILEPGDLALYDASQPYQLTFDGHFEQLVVQFPRQSLISRNLHIESTVARTCSGRAGIGAVAASLVRTLPHHDSEISEDHRRRLGEQVIDFAATALGSVTGSLTADQSVKAFNRQRVLDHVNRNLHDPGLSVAAVAQSFGVSSRTIQKLFAEDSTALGARIREARVARAKRALADPALSHLSISQIAHDVGFGSPAQFARVFRAANGCSPRDFRDAAAG